MTYKNPSLILDLKRWNTVVIRLAVKARGRERREGGLNGYNNKILQTKR